MLSVIFYLTKILSSIEIEVVSTRYNEIVLPDRLSLKKEKSLPNEDPEKTIAGKIIIGMSWIAVITIFIGELLFNVLGDKNEVINSRPNSFAIVFFVTILVFCVAGLLRTLLKK